MPREVTVSTITDTIASLCGKANVFLPSGSRERLALCGKRETSPLCREIFGDLVKNLDCAAEHNIPICQDTGMAVVFLDIGQDVHIVGGDLTDAVNDGVRRGYKDNYLRMSVVRDPLERVNTGDNTPCIIHTRIVSGDKVSVTLAPKGFGSENMSAIKMFTPSASREDIIAFVTNMVQTAGGNPCPPIVVGVGLGGDFEYAAILAKRALIRGEGELNAAPFYRELENDMLTRINALGIGAGGFGGDITALAVNIEVFPTHIAGLPCAVNIGCHVNRHLSAVI
ncbi:MAG: fumarate hydratase [Oscillospiraceae bacterium]|jgi:fumarate hydratase subunit alpha|nr:fumarate hydratase [Oscillospiraceae bacterium]